MLSEIGTKMWMDGGKLSRKTRGGFRVEVVDTVERLREILLICHKGMGLLQLGSVYYYFSRNYWVPVAIKLIKHHVLTCGTCQQFVADISAPHASRGSYSLKRMFLRIGLWTLLALFLRMQ